MTDLADPERVSCSRHPLPSVLLLIKGLMSVRQCRAAETAEHGYVDVAWVGLKTPRLGLSLLTEEGNSNTRAPEARPCSSTHGCQSDTFCS